MELDKKLPLYIVTGASGVGKSTACQKLMERERDFIVMESDILWEERYNTPEDGYRQYRELWLHLCAQISQGGRPVVLCGCAMPEQFEACAGRQWFTHIHYLALVCEQAVLESRLRGRGVQEERWLCSSLDFNGWLRENGPAHMPEIRLLDTTALSPEEASAGIEEWIFSVDPLAKDAGT